MARPLFFLTVYLLFVGLAISSILLYLYTSSTPIPCSISHGCDVVRNSPYAKLFGIPIPFFGVLFYILALGLSGAVLKLQRMRYLFALWALCTWGVLFAGYLTYLEAFVINAWCSWCVANALVNLATFIISSYILWATLKGRSIAGHLRL